MKEMNKLAHLGIGRYRRDGRIATIFLMIDVAIGLIIPFTASMVLDKLIPSGEIEKAKFYCMIMLLLSFFGIISLMANTYFSQKASQYGAADLREEVYKKIQSFNLKEVDKYQKGRLISSITNDITQIRTFYSQRYSMFLRAPMYFIGGFIFAVMTSYKLSSIYLIIMPLLIVSIFLIYKSIPIFFDRLQKTNDALNTKSIDNVNGVRIFKSFVTENKEYKEFEEISNTYEENFIEAETRLSLLMPLCTFILNCGICLLIVIGTIFIDNGTIKPEAGIFLAFNTYSMKILTGLLMYSRIFMVMSRGNISAKRLREIIEEEIIFQEGKLDEKDGIQGEIEFKKLEFKYLEDANLVFDKISFKIKAGEKIGVIGSTGSGKSTLTQLISRIYDPTNGEILIDGKNIKDYKIDFLREKISMATQKPILFTGSIRENLLMGRKNATDEELYRALDQAVLGDFVREKEQGLDYLITEKGGNLSGGQKQRLSLTRAFIKKPSILILDDVTSALDSKSEKKVVDNIKMLKETTSIIVSQKISSILDSDKILVFDNYGKINGFDKHENLLVTSKVYKELYESQYGGL